MISTERSELLDALPHVREQPALREGAAGFSYVAEPDNTFVAPSLRQAKPSAAMPSLILVEARAAVGKSMLARHLAWASGGPLWDLSETYVGTGTLWGSLAKAFGPEQLNNIIGRTVTGEFVLIIDALDEAEMHAGGEAFDAFLIELRDMFASPRPMPGAVILGRTETIGYVEIFLSGTVPVSRYLIVDFDRQLAYRFIDNRLDSGKISDPSFTAGAHRKREKLYKEARERLLDFLADRLVPDRHGTHAGREEEVTEDWPARIRSFLGYAPVLETVAEYLASYAANYPALIAELGNMEVDPYHSGNAQWNMLRAIVRRLLEREQGKVITQLRKVISDSEVARWTSLYGPEEQCARVLGRVTRSAELQDLAADVPIEVQARYREVLGNAIPNHPFFGRFFGYANVVFRDYIHEGYSARRVEVQGDYG
jgi:hypothetical protein